MPSVPLRFKCGHEVYTPAAGPKDAHGNTKPGWAAPVPVDCVWWTPESSKPAQPPTGGSRVIVHQVLIVDSALTVDHRDRFIVDGQRHSVVTGLPEDYNHGPWMSPDRLVVNLRRVEG